MAETGKVAAVVKKAPDEDERFRRAWGGRDRLIVVPLDRSPDSLVALHAARVVAVVTRATIRIVLVTSEVTGGREAVGEETERQMATEIGLSRDDLRGTVVESLVTTGDVAEALCHHAVSRRAMLLAVAVYAAGPRMTPLDRASLSRLMESTRCPLLLARPENLERIRSRQQVRRILLPLDGEPTSAAGIRPALDIAIRAGADLDILFVESGRDRPAEPGAMRTPRYVDQPQHEWRNWSTEFSRRFATALGSCDLPENTQVFLRRGEPTEEIERFAAERDADLIVLSWHGTLESDHAMVVRCILESASCPVLLLRAPEPGSEDLPRKA